MGQGIHEAWDTGVDTARRHVYEPIIDHLASVGDGIDENAQKGVKAVGEGVDNSVRMVETGVRAVGDGINTSISAVGDGMKNVSKIHVDVGKMQVPFLPNFGIPGLFGAAPAAEEETLESDGWDSDDGPAYREKSFPSVQDKMASLRGRSHRYRKWYHKLMFWQSRPGSRKDARALASGRYPGNTVAGRLSSALVAAVQTATGSVSNSVSFVGSYVPAARGKLSPTRLLRRVLRVDTISVNDDELDVTIFNALFIAFIAFVVWSCTQHGWHAVLVDAPVEYAGVAGGAIVAAGTSLLEAGVLVKDATIVLAGVMAPAPVRRFLHLGHSGTYTGSMWSRPPPGARVVQQRSTYQAPVASRVSAPAWNPLASRTAAPSYGYIHARTDQDERAELFHKGRCGSDNPDPRICMEALGRMPPNKDAPRAPTSLSGPSQGHNGPAPGLARGAERGSQARGAAPQGKRTAQGGRAPYAPQPGRSGGAFPPGGKRGAPAGGRTPKAPLNGAAGPGGARAPGVQAGPSAPFPAAGRAAQPPQQQASQTPYQQPYGQPGADGYGAASYTPEQGPYHVEDSYEQYEQAEQYGSWEPPTQQPPADTPQWGDAYEHSRAPAQAAAQAAAMTAGQMAFSAYDLEQLVSIGAMTPHTAHQITLEQNSAREKEDRSRQFQAGRCGTADAVAYICEPLMGRNAVFPRDGGFAISPDAAARYRSQLDQQRAPERAFRAAAAPPPARAAAPAAGLAATAALRAAAAATVGAAAQAPAPLPQSAAFTAAAAAPSPSPSPVGGAPVNCKVASTQLRNVEVDVAQMNAVLATQMEVFRMAKSQCESLETTLDSDAATVAALLAACPGRILQLEQEARATASRLQVLAVDAEMAAHWAHAACVTDAVMGATSSGHSPSMAARTAALEAELEELVNAMAEDAAQQKRAKVGSRVVRV